MGYYGIFDHILTKYRTKPITDYFLYFFILNNRISGNRKLVLSDISNRTPAAAFLAHSHAYAFPNCPWLLWGYSGRGDEAQEPP